MEYVVGQKVLCINLYKCRFGVYTIKNITPKGIIKLSCGLRFTEDGYPYGFKTYIKKCIVEYGEKEYYSWRLLDATDRTTNELWELGDKAYQREKERRLTSRK